MCQYHPVHTRGVRRPPCRNRSRLVRLKHPRGKNAGFLPLGERILIGLSINSNNLNIFKLVLPHWLGNTLIEAAMLLQLLSR